MKKMFATLLPVQFLVSGVHGYLAGHVPGVAEAVYNNTEDIKPETRRLEVIVITDTPKTKPAIPKVAAQLAAIAIIMLADAQSARQLAADLSVGVCTQVGGPVLDTR